MSKREFKKYLTQLDKEQLQEQFIMLYEKFGEVKTYYNFVFNPKEDKLLQEAKLKVAQEYFPLKGKRPKLRRSVAQRYIKHFLLLGVDPFVVADLMLYAMETAQKFSAKREMRFVSFYKSMLNSFGQAVKYAIANGIQNDFRQRIEAISAEAQRQKWENCEEFERFLEEI